MHVFTPTYQYNEAAPSSIPKTAQITTSVAHIFAMMNLEIKLATQVLKRRDYLNQILIKQK